eukprot:jgi/Mesen1/7271/ME000373S06348
MDVGHMEQLNKIRFEFELSFKNEQQTFMRGVMDLMNTQKKSWQTHYEQAITKLEQEFQRRLATSLHMETDKVEVKGENNIPGGDVAAKGRPRKRTATTSIMDLPVDILQRILRSVCAEKQVEKGVGGVSKAQVKCVSRVCTKWHHAVRSSYKRAICDSFDVETVLRQLHTAPNVTHVSVPRVLDTQRELVRRLATEFPLITSFHLSIDGTKEALDILALFLSLKTNIQELELSLHLRGLDGFDCSHKALEDMDFSGQAHLKKLAIDYSITFPESSRDGDRWRVPVSTTLARLANLQELHITVQHYSVSAPLPPWLAQLPAFVGLEIFSEEEAPSRAFLDFVRTATGLRKLTFYGYLEDGRGMDVISWLGHLTSLTLYSHDRTTLPPVGSFLLSPSLVELDMPSDLFASIKRPLPLLKALTLAPPGSAAIPMDHFAFTPNLTSLHLELWDEEAGWPRLGHLAGLASLSLELFLMEVITDANYPFLNVPTPQRAWTRSLRNLQCQLAKASTWLDAVVLVVEKPEATARRLAARRAALAELAVARRLQEELQASMAELRQDLVFGVDLELEVRVRREKIDELAGEMYVIRRALLEAKSERDALMKDVNEWAGEQRRLVKELDQILQHRKALEGEVLAKERELAILRNDFGGVPFF